METRENIAAGEVFEHTGDLTINGDVGSGARITVIDGSLIIKEGIKSAAIITLKTSEPQNSSLIPQLNNSSYYTNTVHKETISSFFGFGGSRYSFYSNVNGGIESITANKKLGNEDNIYMGNVNVNNRILTNHQLHRLGNNKYKIIQGSGKTATATIDNIKYTGKEILIDGKNVVVDGVKKTADIPNKLDPIHWPPKLIVEGNILARVIINSKGDVNVKGTIGPNCEVNSLRGEITAGDVAPNVLLQARKEISVGNIGDHCTVNSSMKGITGKTVGNEVVLTAQKEIHLVGNIGARCTLSSDESGVVVKGSLGDHCNIEAEGDITLGTVGSHAKIDSSLGSVIAENFSSPCSIKAYGEVTTRQEEADENRPSFSQ